jgi:ribosomal protein S18 acetylase RimI-like enzyme
MLTTAKNGSFFLYYLQLLEALNSFYVVERDGSIIACAALFPFAEDKSGEVAALAVSEECRGRGQGDKLLGTFIATGINRICSPLVIAIIYPTPCPHVPVPSFSHAYAILKG